MEEKIEEKITQSSEVLPVKKKKPWLIVILIALVIISFGAMGVLAYQNYLLKNQIEKKENSLIMAKPTPTPNTEIDNQTYKLVSDEDEQQALKEAIVKYYNDYANAKEEPKNISIGYPFIKYRDWYYLNAGFIDTPSGFSVYIRKDKNELKIAYLGQDCPPENLVTKYPDERDKIPIDALNLRCSPYYTVNPK